MNWDKVNRQQRVGSPTSLPAELCGRPITQKQKDYIVALSRQAGIALRFPRTTTDAAGHIAYLKRIASELVKEAKRQARAEAIEAQLRSLEQDASPKRSGGAESAQGASEDQPQPPGPPPSRGPGR